MFALLSKVANFLTRLYILTTELILTNIIRLMNSNIDLLSNTVICYLVEAYHPYKQGDLTYKKITILRHGWRVEGGFTANQSLIAPIHYLRR